MSVGDRSLLFVLRVAPALGAFVIAIACGEPLASQEAKPSFAFSLRGAGALERDVDIPFEFDLRAQLEIDGITEEPVGPEAWSMAMTATGCSIVELVTDGTAIEEALGLRPGVEAFVRAFVAPEGGAATIAVVLGFESDVSLSPAGSPHHVLTIGMQSQPPPADECLECSVGFENGVEGPSEPVDNVVSYAQESFLLSGEALGEKTIRMCRDLCDIDPPIFATDEGRRQELLLDEDLTERCLRVRGLEGRALVLDLEPEQDVDGTFGLFVRRAAPATTSEFDFVAADRERPDQRIVIPDISDDDYFVLVVALSDSEPTRLGLTAQLARKAVGGVFPRRGALGFESSCLVTGAGFDDDTEFALRRSDSDELLSAENLTLVSATEAEMTFDIPGDTAWVGVHDLVVFDRAEPSLTLAELSQAFQVFADPPSGFDVRVLSRERVRTRRLSSLTLQYENIGGHELPAPLLKVVASSSDTRLRLGSRSSFGARNLANELVLLGVDQAGVAGSLPPGALGEIPLDFIFDAAVAADLEFEVFHFLPNDVDRVDWPNLRPAGVSAQDWASVWPLFQARPWSTWREFVDGLADFSSRLKRRGRDSASALDAFRLAYREASGCGVLAARGVCLSESGESPLSGALLFAVGAGNRVHCAHTDDQGRFVFEGLDEGSYAVSGADLALEGDTEFSLTDTDLLGLVVVGRPGVGAELSVEDCDDGSDCALPLEVPEPPNFSLVRKTSKRTQTIQSWDPNEKRGPRGRGRRRWIRPRSNLEYTVYFENLPQATAPAQVVEIVDDLRGSNLDIRTVCLREVRFADCIVHLDQPGLLPLARREDSPSDVYPFTSRCDGAIVEPDVPLSSVPGVSPFISYHAPEGFGGSMVIRTNHIRNDQEWPLLLEISASVDFDEETITWRLESLPSPALPGPLDDEAGFLPPNEECDVGGQSLRGRGEGHVSFTIRPRRGLGDGRRIRNRATIRFDQNDPIDAPMMPPNERDLTTCEAGLPATPHSSAPSNGVARVSIAPLLRWESDCRAASYRVFVWREGEGKPVQPTCEGIEEAECLLSGLTGEIEYRWTVEATNEDGEPPAVAAPIWSFTTAATSPCPVEGLAPDDSECRRVPVMLSWQSACRAEAYAVFVSPAPGRDPEFRATVRSTSFESSDLDPGEYFWSVSALSSFDDAPELGSASGLASFTVCAEPLPRFLRGDADGSGALNITDAIFVLGFLFLGQPDPSCHDAADFNDDQTVNITDAIAMLSFLFLGAEPPKPPGGACGFDPTEDDLACEEESDSCS